MFDTQGKVVAVAGAFKEELFVKTFKLATVSIFNIALDHGCIRRNGSLVYEPIETYQAQLFQTQLCFVFCSDCQS